MTDEKRPDEAEPEFPNSTPGGLTKPGRRPWQTPSIESGQLYEANSLSCGKDTPMNEQCMMTGLSSS